MELKTRAYIQVHSTTGEEIGPIFKEPIESLEHKELVLRNDAETYIARVESQLSGTLRQIEALVREKATLQHDMEDLRLRNDELAESLAYERNMHADTLRQRYSQDNRMLDIMMALQRARPGSVFPSAEEARDMIVAAFKPRSRLVRALRMLFKG
jgi:chromosome segregation ATPase